MFKRLFDFSAAFVLLFLTAPLMLLLMVMVALFLGRPIFFSQVRPGLNGIPFRMLKFRSMRDVRNSNGEMLADELRLSKFGRFLRASSLDELPELWNVLRGEMSLVGPRPLLMEYLPLYSTHQARRHEVRPGITGWAQVNGRNAIGWEEKFDLDVWYVENQSFALDIRILILTIKSVLSRKGVTQEGRATADKFKGNGCA
ncbi:sugar transferase [Chitiniphilus shinanonensis]|uniref:sugar transferase n=1 Tax=Chitiniphilus shinanonensis TaxID=553088 RepID=UPI003DA74D3C